jgi:putative nucleotidyltransferase with HDIG domain
MQYASAKLPPELKALELKIDELPLLPQVLVKVLQLDPASDDYFDAFETLSREDPGLSIRLIALANSAASSPAAEINTIRKALARMRTTIANGLVCSLAVQRVFMPHLPNQIRLWRHSIAVAVAAEQLAKIAPALKVDPEQAYLVDLLHDVGRFVMFEHAAENLLRVDEFEWDSPEQLVESDIEVFNFTHCELGYLACQHWKLPTAITIAVRDHHNPIETGFKAGSQQALLLCNRVAGRLAMALIEKESLEALSSAEVEEIVLADCLTPLRAAALFPATRIVAKIPDLRARCDLMMGGLGF